MKLERLDRWRFLGQTKSDGKALSDGKAVDIDQYITKQNNSQPPIGESLFERKIDLRYLSIACYFNKLIDWNKEFPTKPTDNTLSTVLSNNSSDVFLFGEVVKECDYDESSDISRGTVTVHLDSKSSKYTLIIKGSVPFKKGIQSLVEKRYQRILQMVEDAVQIRQIHQLSTYWKRPHRLGISDSEVINHQEDATKSCVLFHHSGPTTLVEIVSLKYHQHNKMRKFLESLVPRECKRDILYSCISSFDDSDWENIRKQYAVTFDANENKDSKISNHSKIKIGSNGNQVITITAWGFGTLIDDALNFICNPIKGSNKDVETITKPSYQSNVDDNRQNNFNLTSLLHSNQREQNVSRNIKGSYTFQDCEAGIFFFAFEKEFKEFIEYTFNVTLDENCNNTNKDEGNCDIKSNSDAVRKAVLRVEFYGSSSKDVTATKLYLEQLNTANLARFQIYFPQSTSIKYKELQSKKNQQNLMLRSIRGMELSEQSQVKGTSIIDPLSTKGSLNVFILSITI